jgi:hypothetical protein
MSNARDKANIPALNFSSTGIDDNATSTAITIDSSENVTFGGKLTINTTEGAPLTLHHTDGSNITMFFQNNSSDSHYLQFASNDFVIAPNNTERMRITSSGNVGIGTTSPSEKLEVSDGKLLVKTTSGASTIEIVSPGGTADSVLNFGDTADNNVGVIAYEHDNNAFRFLTNATERMRIHSNGHVAIGTTASGADLELETTEKATGNNLAGGGICLRNSGTVSGGNVLPITARFVSSAEARAGIGFVAQTQDGIAGYAGEIAFYTMGSADGAQLTNSFERVRINKSGNVGIGISTPSSKFESVLATAGGNYPAFLKHTASSGTTRILRGQMSGHAPNDTTSVFITMGDNTATRFNVFSNGDVTNSNNSYTGISDIKLKEQIVDASSQWEDIKNLQVKKFKFKTDVATGDSDKHWRLGVIAQEVEQISPSLVSETPDLDDNHNELDTVTKSVKYSILYMKAVKALQEAMERIETLETKVQTLENNQP